MAIYARTEEGGSRRTWRCRAGAEGPLDEERGPFGETLDGSDRGETVLSFRRPDLVMLGLGYRGKDTVADGSRFLRRELQREKAWSRIHLVPLLLAEGDRDAYRRQAAALAREKEIMKDVKDWEVRAFISRGLCGRVADALRFVLALLVIGCGRVCSGGQECVPQRAISACGQHRGAVIAYVRNVCLLLE